MILFKENPNLKLTTVTTVRGDTEYRRNCRYISKKYYRVDRDCFNLDDTWYRYDGGNIVFDHEREEWILSKNATGMLKGIVAVKDDGTLELGQFTPNPYNNVRARCSATGIQFVLNEDILKKAGYVEDVATCVWYSKRELSPASLKKIRSIRNEKNFTDRGYNIEENVNDFAAKVKHYEAYTPTISRKARTYARYLGDLTFGAEIEIVRGNMPESRQNRYGIVICRDGSIDGGPELVTIPLSGAKGLQTIKNISEDLIERGDISIACAFHNHLGNIRTDKLFIVALYILCRKIQDELFTMFPYYKTDHTGIKRKNYNQKLDSLGIYPLVKKDKESFETYLTDSYARIFDFLAEGRITLDRFNRKTREHPIPRKWERQNRYYWANFMNLFFGHRNTIEFRLHQATTNHHKMINWLFISNAIVRYADAHAAEIITSKGDIAVKDILNVYRDLHKGDENAEFLSCYLYDYFVTRQKEFAKDFKKGDFLSQWDMDNDKEYKFSYNDVCGLV